MIDYIRKQNPNSLVNDVFCSGFVLLNSVNPNFVHTALVKCVCDEVVTELQTIKIINENHLKFLKVFII